MCCVFNTARPPKIATHAHESASRRQHQDGMPLDDQDFAVLLVATKPPGSSFEVSDMFNSVDRYRKRPQHGLTAMSTRGLRPAWRNSRTAARTCNELRPSESCNSKFARCVAFLGHSYEVCYSSIMNVVLSYPRNSTVVEGTARGERYATPTLVNR